MHRRARALPTGQAPAPARAPAAMRSAPAAMPRRARLGHALPRVAALAPVLLALLAAPDRACGLVHPGTERVPAPRSLATKPVLALRDSALALGAGAARGCLRGGGAAAGDAPRVVMGKRTWWSRMTFSYVNSLLEAGFDHPLEAEELPDLPEDHAAEVHVRSLEDAWFERKAAADALAQVLVAAAGESAQDQEKRTKAMLEKVLAGAVWGRYGTMFMMAGLWKVVQDVLSFATPFMVKTMYKYVDPKEAIDPALQPWSRGLAICAGFFLVQYVSSVALHQYFDEVFAVSLQVRAGLVAFVYRKALRLSHASRSHKSLGELVNLMSVDVQRMTDLVPYLHNLMWSSPLQILISMVLLYRLVGVASLVGLIVMIAVMPVNAAILLKLRKLQEANMKEKDSRVKQVSEMLASIKVIKMFAWEKPLATRIAKERSREVDRLKKYGYLSSLQSIFWNSAPVTVSMATFGAYAALGNTLDMHIVLPALAIINIMSFPLFVLPLLISAVISGRVAMARLNDFLNLPERDTSHITITPPGAAEPITLSNVTVGRNASRPIVRDINVSFKKGSLTAIIGPVGSGKSTVLASILGDAIALAGRVSAPDSVGYVPQQAWIQNANVRDNILFGKPYDERRYRATIAACALEADFEKFPDGDMTEIGERGVNLSGGQKQRISLARAVYQNSQTLLLDDVLSALDSHVGAHVLDKCLLDLLGNTTRVLVTHKLDVLHSVDNILVLGEGKVLAQGTLQEVVAQGIDLKSVLAEAQKAAEQDSQVEQARDLPADERKEGGAEGAGTKQAPKVQESATRPEGAAAGGKVAGGREGGEGTPKRSKSFQLVERESRAVGAVSTEIYLTYLRELQYPMLAVITLIGAASQAARNGNDWWLTRWASADDRHRVKYYLGLYALRYACGRESLAWPSPTLSPTDPVPRGLLTLSPCLAKQGARPGRKRREHVLSSL